MSKFKWQLDRFLDHKTFSKPIELPAKHIVELVDSLKLMLKIRCVEQKLALERKNGVIKGPVHLGIGQEAVAAGVSKFVNSQDRVF